MHTSRLIYLPYPTIFPYIPIYIYLYIQTQHIPSQCWMPGRCIAQGLSYRGSYALIGVKGGAALDEKALRLSIFRKWRPCYPSRFITRGNRVCEDLNYTWRWVGLFELFPVKLSLNRGCNHQKLVFHRQKPLFKLDLMYIHVHVHIQNQNKSWFAISMV